MAYNHGLAKKEFEKEWQKKEIQYKALGMTEKQISSIRKFGEQEFRAERVYFEKKVPLALVSPLIYICFLTLERSHFGNYPFGTLTERCSIYRNIDC